MATYVHFSLKKMIAILFLVLLLVTSLFATTWVKEWRYGTTPAFASIALAFEETTLGVRYTIEELLWRARTLYPTTAPDTNNVSRKARALPVLTYHRIASSNDNFNNVTTEHFRDQMLTLKRAGWNTVTVLEFIQFMRGERELPERSVIITFDDGAKESFYPVDPLFRALGFTGAMYVIASAPHIAESVYYLSSVEVARMLKTGRWELGSHSYDGHRPYPTDARGSSGIFFADKLWRAEDGRVESDEEFTQRVYDDLERSRITLEREYGVSINHFAFPLGNETGIEGAANFPEGASITENEASKIYDVGFIQTNNQTFTYNYPPAQFLARRIHVHYDWDGARLLEELERGLPKNLPFEDDFANNRGWIPAWGTLDLGRNNLSIRANSDASSASTFLDGSRLWDNYSFDAALNWNAGSVFLLADLRDSKTYRACAFSPGVVRIQTTIQGITHTNAETRDERIQFGTDVRLGVRVHDSVIECLVNYESIIESYDRVDTGGIGIQIWNPALGTASLQVSEVLVRAFTSGTTTDAVPRLETGE